MDLINKNRIKLLTNNISKEIENINIKSMFLNYNFHNRNLEKNANKTRRSIETQKAILKTINKLFNSDEVKKLLEIFNKIKATKKRYEKSISDKQKILTELIDDNSNYKSLGPKKQKNFKKNMDKLQPKITYLEEIIKEETEALNKIKRYEMSIQEILILIGYYNKNIIKENINKKQENLRHIVNNNKNKRYINQAKIFKRS